MTCLLPSLLFDSVVIQPPHNLLFSPEAGARYVHTRKSISIGHYLALLLGLPQESPWLGDSSEQGRWGRKCCVLSWQHKKMPVMSCRRKLCSLPEALLWMRVVPYTWDCSNKCLRLIVWGLLFDFCLSIIIYSYFFFFWYSKPLSVANSCKPSFILFWIWFSFSVDHTNNSITHWIIEQ